MSIPTVHTAEELKAALLDCGAALIHQPCKPSFCAPLRDALSLRDTADARAPLFSHQYKIFNKYNGTELVEDGFRFQRHVRGLREELGPLVKGEAHWRCAKDFCYDVQEMNGPAMAKMMGPTFKFKTPVLLGSLAGCEEQVRISNLSLPSLSPFSSFLTSLCFFPSSLTPFLLP